MSQAYAYINYAFFSDVVPLLFSFFFPTCFKFNQVEQSTIPKGSMTDAISNAVRPQTPNKLQVEEQQEEQKKLQGTCQVHSLEPHASRVGLVVWGGKVMQC